jgi:hypothetical protein
MGKVLKKALIKELKQRGTAEISNGVVNQVTQALSENKDKTSYLMFGEMKESGIIPIEQACAKCKSGVKKHFKTVEDCQVFQKKEGESRGFHSVICPQQMEER